jgi:hypothetical protein
VAQPKYSASEVVRKGELLYAREIRHQVEPAHVGEFLAVDIESGSYEVDRDELAAINRARARNPDAVLYLVKVGYPAAHRLGGPKLLRTP